MSIFLSRILPSTPRPRNPLNRQLVFFLSRIKTAQSLLSLGFAFLFLAGFYFEIIAALTHTARTKKRVTATPQPTGINDRYRFRCFMLHIGMIGPAYATARRKLLAPLSGNSGWLVPPEKAPAPEAEVAADE